jgi:hypothetical protein
MPEQLTVKVHVEHGPRMNDPLGQSIAIAVRFSGDELIEVKDPGAKDLRVAMAQGLAPERQRAVAEGLMEIGDRVFQAIFDAGQTALFGTEIAYRAKHPTELLRREIADLRKELEDITHRLTLAETQRDELRRIFEIPVIVQGSNDVPSIG